MSSSNDEPPPGPPPGSDEEAAMTEITDPRETDVLCGRGGAALRHPGNLTYRRLVNLNKGLYISCLKTEKLKISRSIVAAIREQKGRFLERDATKGTWYDIGDKKAIEKTSQALREGQPKLRQKMVEMGQIPPEQGVTPLQQQFGNGVYAPRQTPSIGSIGSVGSGGGFAAPNPYGMHNHMGSIGSFGSHSSQQYGNSMADMPPPPSRTMSNDMNSEMAMMQRLSLTAMPQSIPSWTPSVTSVGPSTMDEAQARSSLRNRMRPPSMNSRNTMTSDLGGQQSALSLMSDFSAYGPSDRQIDMEFPVTERVGSMDPMQQQQQQQHHQQLQQQQQQQQQQQRRSAFATGGGSGGGSNTGDPFPPSASLSPTPMKETNPSASSRFDRRRFFAKMKYSRPGDASQKSINDGMPDIHMVDSQFSLLSNLSGHGSRHHTSMDVSAHGEAKEIGSNKESMGSEFIGVGSRRSLMSGLSRISNHSDHFNNPFSDMSKKIGGATNHTNMSTRSIAMSEISGIEEGFAEDDMDEFSFDLPPPRAGSAQI